MIDYLQEYPPVLTVEQVSQIMGIGKQLVRKEIQNKEIPAIKVGRIYRIPKTKLLEYLDHTQNY